MKPRILSTARLSFALASALAALFAAPSARAVTYYYDNNTDAASFGTAGGTWAAPTTSGWTTNAAGTTVPGSVTTATADTLNFGTSSDGLAAGTITVSGTVSSGNITFGSASGAIVLSGGTITLAAAPTITVDNASNTINSVLAGVGTTLTKAGSGTLILSGSNTYTGATTVNGGTLSITGSGAIYSNLAWVSRVVTVNNAVLEIDRWNIAGSLGQNDYKSANLVLNGGTLRYIGSETLTRADGDNARAFSLGAGGGTLESNATAGKEWVIANGNALPSFSTTLTLAGSGNGYIGKAISGTGGAGGSLVKTGDGTWTLDAINTYTGATTVNEGTLELLKTVSGSGTIRGVLNINAGGAVRSSVNNSLGYDSTRVPTVNINGGTLIGGASKQLVFWGTTLNLTGGNVFIENGATFLFGGGGNDPLAAVNTLASANTTIFSGTGTAAISLQQANLTFDVADGTAATDLRISLPISGPGNGITKTGAGTMELSGVNTYTGATTVSAGTLAVNGTGSINSSAVTVNGGTFRYNSSVAYSGALTYTSGTVGGTNLTGSLGGQTIGTGKTIAPGNSPGTATTTSQTWAGGGTYDWEINDANASAGADPGWDLLSGTGTLTISATSGSQFNLNLYSLSLLNVAGSLTDFNNANSYNWLIADFTNAVSGFSANAFNVIDTNFSNNNTLNGTFGVALGDTVLGGDNSQIYLTYTSIPEPRAALLGGLGLLMLLRRRRN
jgi:autotransporter-associated beta strand protein